MKICLNEDNGHFYANRTQDQMNEDEVKKLVDRYAEFGVDALFFCTNIRRALFNSQAWEPVYHGYDPEAGLDQPVLKGLNDQEKTMEIGNQGLQLLHNLWLLKERGIDHHQLWLEQCRKHGIEGWLTMRMNDVHHSNNLDYFWHSSLWKERRDLWRVTHKFESWWDRAFDYGKPEVREHHFKLIKELVERYDMTGLELDWIRAIYHFAPGREQEGCRILTEFVRDVRKLLDEWSEKRGHKIKLSVRIPENPETGQRLGMDAVTWIREGLVDQIVLSQWLSVLDFDPPVAIWRGIIGDRDVDIALNVSGSVMPYSAAWASKGLINANPELLRGMAASAAYNQVDRLYFFNYCYSSTNRPEFLKKVLADARSPENLDNKPRRHVVTYYEIAAPGQSESSVLPVSFTENRGISKYGEAITLYPNVGNLSSKLGNAKVIIGFDRNHEIPESAEELTVRINGEPCRFHPDPVVDTLPEMIEPYTFSIPENILHDGRNSVEITSSTKRGTVAWLEIFLQPV